MEKIQETLDAFLGRFDQLSGDVDCLKQKAQQDEVAYIPPTGRGLEEEGSGAADRRSRSRSASLQPRSHSRSASERRNTYSMPSGGSVSRKRSWYDSMMNVPDECR